jgi:hypothetical protein
MNMTTTLKLSSAIVLVWYAQTATAGPDDAAAASAAAAAAAALSRSASLELRLSDPALLSPPGFAADELELSDDFLHRAVAFHRVELVRFVDEDGRRVFLGLTRDGFLGIQVQRRDRR